MTRPECLHYGNGVVIAYAVCRRFRPRQYAIQRFHAILLFSDAGNNRQGLYSRSVSDTAVEETNQGTIPGGLELCLLVAELRLGNAFAHRSCG